MARAKSKAKSKKEQESNYQDHAWMIKNLKQAQTAESDMREQAREADLFLSKRDGQWEPWLWDSSSGKPRYTFDQVTPIVDMITGEIESTDFDIVVSPAGGDSTKEIAETFDGLVRNIETISDADQVYNASSRRSTICGIAGWRVVQDYTDADSFDQDLIVEPISNYVDRVWHGPHERRDASDANYCWVLTGLTPEDYEAKYPEGSGHSVGQDTDFRAYFYRQDLVMVGEFLYVEEKPVELVKMNNGKVYEVDDDFNQVVDDLAMMQIVEEDRRVRMKRCVYSRLFDAEGWLDKPAKTVFTEWIPVIPLYANFDVVEDKVVYHGAVEKLMDPQRVLNYILSREIEEGALAPRAKYWMSQEQAVGFEDSLKTMNTNTDPVQFFNPDERLPGTPQQTGGAQVNPGLRIIGDSMQSMISQTAGMFASSMGDNPGLQSGVAIDALQDAGSIGNNKFAVAREYAQRHTGRILINAIPDIYGPGRQVRILDEDGSFEMVTIGEQVLDQQTGEVVVLNDLSQGKYDVVCSSGPSYKNRQSETVSTILEMGKIDPSVVETAGDVLFNNIPAPGMSTIAERKRAQLINAGLIPPEQYTEEETAKAQQAEQMAQQNPPVDPMMVAAQAEQQKAQADMLDAENKKAQIMIDAKDRQQARMIDGFKAETDRMNAETARGAAAASAQQAGASAAKSLSEAEAQDIENDAAVSGIMDLVEGLKNVKAG